VPNIAVLILRIASILNILALRSLSRNTREVFWGALLAGQMLVSSTGGQLKMENLKGINVAILVADGFEEVEMVKPRQSLEQAGAKTTVISPKGDRVRSWQHTEWGKDFRVELALNKAHPDDFDALLLPGGVMSPDKLRMDPSAVQFVKAFFDAGKPVAAICHGPWTIIEAGAARGRHMTSWPSLKADLKNAGAEWTDQQSVIDGNLVTSRKPDDIPVFTKAMIDVFSSVHEKTMA
jgi:protease I